MANAIPVTPTVEPKAPKAAPAEAPKVSLADLSDFDKLKLVAESQGFVATEFQPATPGSSPMLRVDY